MENRREDLINVYAAQHIDDQREIKRLHKELDQVKDENCALKQVISLLMKNNVEVWRLEEIENRKPIVLKLQENIGNEIIVRIER